MSDPFNHDPSPSPLGDILVVDDVPENLAFLSKILREHGYKVRNALTGQVALNVARAAQPNLILLDIKMPEMNGYQVCNRLKVDPLTQDIPIIFLSALDQTQDKVKALEVGGVDYISKPFQAEELLARVGTHIALRAAQIQVQTLNTELERRVTQRTAQLEQEIGERLRIQQKVLYMATHDNLTGLPSRVFLSQRLSQILNQNPHQPTALILLKGNQLKTINNSLGHHAVDQLLISMQRRLESCLDDGILLAFYGEETFALLIEYPIDQANILELAQRLRQEMLSPFHIDRCPVYVQICMGIVLASKGYEKATHILRDATTALSQAEAQRFEKIQVFNSEMYHRALSFFETQNDLHRALEQQELQLVYQPIISLETNALKGAEALVRWHHPTMGVLSPDRFIPIAEETALIVNLDRLVIRQACYQLRTWQESGVLPPSFRLQVNLSSLQLIQTDFIDYLCHIFEQTQAKPEHLALEITEYGLMQQNTVILTNLEYLKRSQINVSIDDFGTGYSCLSYLNQLRVENIKIDKSFIQKIENAQGNQKVLSAIINLAHDLDMTVTAEGIESLEQLEAATALGCEFGQGYLLGEPTDGDRLFNQK
ncbi:MAG: EAL domain-containing protein [Cyanobacteria bacterium P01_F01_bin.150]